MSILWKARIKDWSFAITVILSLLAGDHYSWLLTPAILTSYGGVALVLKIIFSIFRRFSDKKNESIRSEEEIDAKRADQRAADDAVRAKRQEHLNEFYISNIRCCNCGEFKEVSIPKGVPLIAHMKDLSNNKDRDNCEGCNLLCPFLVCDPIGSDTHRSTWRTVKSMEEEASEIILGGLEVPAGTKKCVDVIKSVRQSMRNLGSESVRRVAGKYEISLCCGNCEGRNAVAIPLGKTIIEFLGGNEIVEDTGESPCCSSCGNRFGLATKVRDSAGRWEDRTFGELLNEEIDKAMELQAKICEQEERPKKTA